MSLGYDKGRWRGRTLVLACSLAALVAGCDQYDLFAILKAESAAPPPPVDTTPDYTVTNVTYPSMGSTGAAFSGNFTVTEMSGHDGGQVIAWRIYRSFDTILDGLDTLAASGSHGAVAAGGSAVVPFSGTWPAGNGTYHYLIVDFSAADDTDTTNNTKLPLTADRIAVPDTIPEAVANNDGGHTLAPPTAGTFQNLGSLADGRLVLVTGTMDASSGTDTFEFATSGLARRVDLTATWATGADDVDLYFLRPTPSTWEPIVSATLNQEPPTAPWQLPSPPLALPPPGQTCYVTVQFTAGAVAGTAYGLLIYTY